MYGAKGEIHLKKLQTPQGKKPLGRYVVCPKSPCSGLTEKWDVNWWCTPPAVLTQQDPVDVQ